MQIHVALSEPLGWRDPRLAEIPLIHLSGGSAGTGIACAEAEAGLLPRHPTVVVGRPKAIRSAFLAGASPPQCKGPAQLGRGRGGKFRPGQGDRRHKRRRDTCPLGLPWEFDPRMKLNTG